MFWVIFGFRYQSDLIVIKKDQNTKKRDITAKVYLKVLCEYLFMILEYNSIFIQNNAPIYKTHKVIDFLIEIGIEVITWPLYSLDLNPIKKPLEDTKSGNR